MRDLDGRAKQKVQAVLRRAGRTAETAITVLSDGEDGLRGVVGWFGRKCEHRLDWFHVSRRLDRIQRLLLYLPRSPIYGSRFAFHSRNLNRIRERQREWLATASLLTGGKRPRNWQDAKAQLGTSLRAATIGTDDPINDWLATFTPTLDSRAADIVLGAVALLKNPSRPAELRYEPQLYDALLRGAAQQLDRCLRSRNEMGAFEITGVSAGIAYLTFLQVKPLQRNLIDQSNNADLDALAKEADDRSAGLFARAAHGFAGLWDKYHMLGLQAEAHGDSAEAQLATQKDQLRTSLLLDQFNIETDAQLTEFTRMLTPGTSANASERYLRLLVLMTEDLADAYYKLYAAAKGVQSVLGMVGLNVGLGAPVPVDIPAFANRVELDAWVQSIVVTPGRQQLPDVVDALVLWCRALMRELDRRSQYETEFTVAVPLSQAMVRGGTKASSLIAQADLVAAFNSAAATGLVTLKLDPSVLPFANAPADLRVLALGLSVEGTIDDGGPLQYAAGFPNTPPVPVVSVGQTPSYFTNPPQNQVQFAEAYAQRKLARLNAQVTTPKQVPAGGGAPYQRPRVYLSNVRIQGGAVGDAEPALNADPSCHNASPWGQWQVQFDPNAVQFYAASSPQTDNWVSGLNLTLRLRATALV